ncbi:MAG: ATP-binding protein [Candidatus Micrarchaeota archaeon]|nr:ATP-binding protein [Candidatus Micrarchaeota archaeon]
MEKLQFNSTAELPIPSNLFDQIIGQDEAVQIAKVAAKQRRHLLLIGPPGTGKSLIAQAIAQCLPPATEEISVLHNPQKPERPFLEIRTKDSINQKSSIQPPKKLYLKPEEVPSFVSQKLGYLCKYCKKISDPEVEICPFCKVQKFKKTYLGPFGDMLYLGPGIKREDNVFSSRIINNREDLVVFRRFNKDLIELSEVEEYQKEKNFERNIIVPLDRKLFVQATGASKTELLGDVRHDPYGGHPQIGIPPYQRIIAGAIHEAHEGVLFIDELVSLGRLQRHILTAMQEKHFPITGRNSSSTGSSVRVDRVPCNFILVSAINLSDLPKIMPQLRSRIAGEGYEIILNTVMEDNLKNQRLFAQFVAQEIVKDGKIPHASLDAVYALLDIAKQRAKKIDKQNGISLRLRSMVGLIKAAGDIAKYLNSPLIEKEHVLAAVQKRKIAEEQLNLKYGSLYKASLADWDFDLSPASQKEIN